MISALATIIDVGKLGSGDSEVVEGMANASCVGGSGVHHLTLDRGALWNLSRIPTMGKEMCDKNIPKKAIAMFSLVGCGLQAPSIDCCRRCTSMRSSERRCWQRRWSARCLSWLCRTRT